jgi:hypothetical protein
VDVDVRAKPEIRREPGPGGHDAAIAEGRIATDGRRRGNKRHRTSGTGRRRIGKATPNVACTDADHKAICMLPDRRSVTEARCAAPSESFEVDVTVIEEASKIEALTGRLQCFDHVEHLSFEPPRRRRLPAH